MVLEEETVTPKYKGVGDEDKNDAAVFVCSKCGFLSGVREFFIPVKRFPIGRRMLCPECWVSRTPSRLARFLKFLGIMVLIFVLLAIPGPTRFFVVWIFIVLLLIIVSPLSIVPHEAGHFVAGMLLGYRIFSATIGAGPLVWKRRIRGIDFEWRLLPDGGFVAATPTSIRCARIKLVLFHAAGPLMNAAISVILIWAAVQYSISFERLGAYAFPLYLSLLPNLLGFALSAWPRTVRFRGKGVPSDGLGILKALFSSKESSDIIDRRALLEAAHAAAAGEYKVAERWAEDAFAAETRPGDASILLASIRLMQGQVETARILLRPFAAKDLVEEFGTHAVFLSSYAALVAGTNEAYVEALAVIAPARAEFHDLRLDAIHACLLIATGEVDAGLSIGRIAFSDPALDRGILAILAYFLAEGEQTRGNLEEAEVYARIAGEMNADSLFPARSVAFSAPALNRSAAICSEAASGAKED